MLTEHEKRWLEDRQHKAYCRYCNVSELCANPFASGYSCPLIGNMKDAAEFSERVAALLANPRWAVCRHGDSCIEYGGDKEDIWLWGCEWCRIKYARLKVEEEMDACD